MKESLNKATKMTSTEKDRARSTAIKKIESECYFGNNNIQFLPEQSNEEIETSLLILSDPLLSEIAFYSWMYSIKSRSGYNFRCPDNSGRGLQVCITANSDGIITECAYNPSYVGKKLIFCPNIGTERYLSFMTSAVAIIGNKTI